MPQRRTASRPESYSDKSPSSGNATPLEPISGTLSLDTVHSNEELIKPLSVEDQFVVERNNVRLKKWRESPFAVGLTEPTWQDERKRSLVGRLHGDDDLPPDESGCLYCSAYICSCLGAGRVGNMAVLRSSSELVEEVEIDAETGNETSRRYTRPRLHWVVGPYWPMLCCVTYPLILGVSGWTLMAGILPGGKPAIVVMAWAVCTSGLITALACTACSDPGIMYKHPNPPPQLEGSWRWSDQALTYKPRTASFDPDTAVVVEGFDHTCPWTGTAIGEKNMRPFQMFVALIFLCMVLDIFIITGAFG